MFKGKKIHSLREAVDFHLEDCQARGHSPRTIEGKLSNLSQFILWCGQNKIRRPSQVNLIVLEAYRRELNQFRLVNGKPLTLATIRKKLTSVKMLFKCLYYHQYLKSNPAALFELPKVPRRLPGNFLNAPEIEQLLDQVFLSSRYGLRDRAILEVYYATGIRRMELAHLTLDNIYLDEKIITIIKGKGQKDRRVPMADRTVYWLKRYLDEGRPKLATLESGIVLFLDNEGLPFREYQLTRIARKYVQRAGINKPGACNLFRHSTATLMHENGADIRHVQEMLGHADISTTQIYTHVTINKLREVYQTTHPAAKSGD